MNTLLDGPELLGLPGAPFLPSLVDIAVASVRADAGWHIAPVVTETITVESFGGRELLLPSLRVVAVASVGTLTGWTFSTAGFLSRSVGWPVGPLEVTLTHGFDSIPPELLPVIAARARAAGQSRVSSVSVGSVQMSYETAGSSSDAALARYSVRVGVA